MNINKEPKNKNISAKEISNLLQKGQKFVITTHINPDGDAIGSAVAMNEYLKEKGKLSQIVLPGALPENMKFLDKTNVIKAFDDSLIKEISNSDIILILDLNDSTRIKPLDTAVLSSNAIKILIDHHLQPKDFADFLFTDSESSSTGELVWRVLNSDPYFNMTKEIADGLYAALMTDTGSFRFPRTSSEVHRIVAALIDAGADPVYIYDQVYNQFPVNGTKLKAAAFLNLETYYKDILCIMKLTRDDFRKTGALEEDTEGLVESILSIKGVSVGILLIEPPDRDEIRISFRAKGEIGRAHV